MTFEEFNQIIEAHINKIDPIFGDFKLNVKKRDEVFGVVEVLCNDEVFVTFYYLVTSSRTDDGHLQLRGSITLRRWNDARWYHEKLERPIVHVGNTGLCHYNGSNDRISLTQVLNEVLPVFNNEKAVRIKQAFESQNINIEGCKFDTYNHRYEVDMNLSDYLDERTESKVEHTYFYKYVSLDTFISMLQNRTFRMNSVVAMNDTSETFALGDAMSDELTVTDRYRSLISSKNALITSFCGDGDSALMWRLYGDNGKGVCLSFSASADTVKPIVYVKKEGRDSKLSKLTEIIKMLRGEGIVVHMKQIDELKYFVKSNQFEYEDEYRLLKYETDENLKLVKYGDLVAYCHDYEIGEDGCIENLNLRLQEVRLGRNLPNPDVNYPLIVDAVNRNFGVEYVNWSRVDALR